MEIQITRSKTGCVAEIDGVEVAKAKSLSAIHNAINKHLGRTSRAKPEPVEPVPGEGA